MVPLVLVERTGEDLQRALDTALNDRPNEEHEWLADVMKEWDWRLSDPVIEVFDFGVGVIRVRCDFVPPGATDDETVRAKIELLSRTNGQGDAGIYTPIARALEDLSHATCERLAEEISHTAAHARDRQWLKPMVAALGTPDPSRAGRRSYRWGELLWLHPVFVVSPTQREGIEELQRLARPFRSDFFRAVHVRSSLFVPGVDASVVVSERNNPIRQLLLQMITLHWAYYALFMEIDRGLLATIDHERWQAKRSLSRLETDASGMFRVHMRVGIARSRLDSILMDIGGGGLALWEAIAESVRFDALVTGVDNKVQLLQDLAANRVQQAAVVRARRVGNVLGALSALTLVTVAATIIGELVGTRNDTAGHTLLRVAAIFVAALLAGVVLLLQREIGYEQLGRWFERFAARAAQGSDDDELG